jgi:peroxin-10
MLVFAQAVLPYIYTRGVSEMKKRSRTSARTIDPENNKLEGIKHSVVQFFKTNLTQIQDFFVKHVRPVHLAVFYFFGAYYNFSKRFAGIRYVS